MTAKELYEKLAFPDQYREMFLPILNELEKEHMISSSQGRYRKGAQSELTATGLLHVHARGFAFLQPDDPAKFAEDIFIPKHLTMNAVDGDRVEVLVNPVVSEKGPEGQVLSIISRGRTRLTGIVQALYQEEALVYVSLLGKEQEVLVEKEEHALKVGDRITMDVVEWGSKGRKTVCRLHHIIGHISDPTTDIPAAIEEFEIRNVFPKNLLKEAEKFGTQVPLSEIQKREDLRKITCVTIDPDTAKDFDDAISLNKAENGHYHLGVHIADVSHYIQPGSPLDIEASLRCNSTYFPGTCIPMLPSNLSDNLCSLKPNVNRLTASVIMEFDPAGQMINYRVSKSVIKSAKRFTYKEAKLVLDGKKKSEHAPLLHLMVELCKLLKKKRYERGSIEFAIPELVIVIDEKGVPQKTELIEYDVTHQMIEEFMIKANEVVATHLSNLGKNLTFRVHDEPSEENMKDFSVLAQAFGFQLSEKPTPLELQKMFDEALSTPSGQYLATSYIRRMRLAFYSADNVGHYGLSLTHYCHFTSPIRRYVDLVAHRVLFGEADERELIEKIAERCSEKERLSAKAENSVLLLKKLRYLQIHEKEHSGSEYQAIITRVKPFGLFFEVVDFMLEGFVHISEIGFDYYIYDDYTLQLEGETSGELFRSGDTIKVSLKKIDFLRQETEWEIVNHAESDKKQKSKKGKKKSEPFKPSKRTSRKSKSSSRRRS